jgi:radical SAM superfamily enzyme YgiQ (UPF0313 family)
MRGMRTLWTRGQTISRPLRVLLIGPYDPHCGEYTFLAPPLGVWRLAGHLRSLGHTADVFDPNCLDEPPEAALVKALARIRWDIVGVSTTGMTLRYDLSLAHIAKRRAPDALLVAGGMEATFDPGLLFRLAPLDMAVLGEGEGPLEEIARRLAAGESLVGVPGTAVPLNAGGAQRFNGPTLDYSGLRRAVALTPYEEMPYEAYWKRLERAYRVDSLPFKAEREARLAEIRSVRLVTLNYCPMACSFCSSTNFLHAAQGSIASIARLTTDDCMDMIRRIVAAQPSVRTVIFQDDIFVFTSDKRILPLCDAIRHAKDNGEIPADLEFISTNRIDAMTPERLAAMKRAGFRVLGFGVESFSRGILEEFNKGQIYRHIDGVLSTAVAEGLTPFLDLILCSPRAGLADVAETIRQAYRWVVRGCEVGIYPYVVPFTGSKMSNDPELAPFVSSTLQSIGGTDISWQQPSHILPIDPETRGGLEEIVASFEKSFAKLRKSFPHVPSRVRSLLWIAAAIPVLRRAGIEMPHTAPVLRKVSELVHRAQRAKALRINRGPAQQVAAGR